MKFVQDKDPVRWFRGYMFIARHPVDVTDRATIDLLSRDNTFMVVADDEVEKKYAPPPRVTSLPQQVRSRLSLPKKWRA